MICDTLRVERTVGPMDHMTEQLNSNEDASRVCTFHSVLVIDDCVETLALHKILLGLEGYEVFTAESGSDAFQVLSEIEKPSLILLDMNLGDMTGTEFLNQLEALNPEILQKVPIVFLSGMSEVPASQAVGFIRKPTDTNKLLADVRHFITQGTQFSYQH